MIDTIVAQARDLAPGLSAEEQRMTDHALVRSAGLPAYLGGPFAQAG